MSEASTPPPGVQFSPILEGRFNVMIDVSDPDPRNWVWKTVGGIAPEGIDLKKLPFGAQGTSAPIVQNT